MVEKKKVDAVEEKRSAPKRVEKAAPSPISSPVRITNARPEKLLSFEQWAARKGIPSHHRGGMRAFVKKNPSRHRTAEQWDACLVGY